MLGDAFGCFFAAEDLGACWRFCEGDEAVEWHDVGFEFGDVGLVGCFAFIAGEPCFGCSSAFCGGGWRGDEGVGLLNYKIEYCFFHNEDSTFRDFIWLYCTINPRVRREKSQPIRKQALLSFPHHIAHCDDGAVENTGDWPDDPGAAPIPGEKAPEEIAGGDETPVGGSDWLIFSVMQLFLAAIVAFFEQALVAALDGAGEDEKMDAYGGNGEHDNKAENRIHSCFMHTFQSSTDKKRYHSKDTNADADHETLAVLGGVIIFSFFDDAAHAVGELDGLLFEEFIGFKLTAVEDELGDAADNEQ